MSVEDRLGYTFKTRRLLQLALTHRSVTNESDETEHNERLEFLGDAIVDFVLSDLLFRQFPAASEGELSRLRASAVNQTSLATKARGYALGKELRLGEGEKKSGGADKDTLLSDTYEAVVAAIYLDGGLQAAIDFVKRGFAASVPTLVSSDPKTELQHLAQKRHGTLPSYAITHESGPEHQRTFRCEVAVDGKPVGHGEGKSKKIAEQAAARAALAILTAPERSKDNP